jgi:hypothetical protein
MGSTIAADEENVIASAEQKLVTAVVAERQPRTWWK